MTEKRQGFLAVGLIAMLVFGALLLSSLGGPWWVIAVAWGLVALAIALHITEKGQRSRRIVGPPVTLILFLYLAVNSVARSDWLMVVVAGIGVVAVTWDLATRWRRLWSD